MIVDKRLLDDSKTWILSLIYGPNASLRTEPIYVYGYQGEDTGPKRSGLTTGVIIVIVIVVFIVLAAIVIIIGVCLAVYVRNKGKEKKKSKNQRNRSQNATELEDDGTETATEALIRMRREAEKR